MVGADQENGSLPFLISASLFPFFIRTVIGEFPTILQSPHMEQSWH